MVLALRVDLFIQDLNGRGAVEQDRHAAVVDVLLTDIFLGTGDGLFIAHRGDISLHAGDRPEFLGVGRNSVVVFVGDLVVAAGVDVVAHGCVKVLHTELFSHLLGVGRVGGEDDLAGSLGDEVVDSGGLSSIKGLLGSSDDQERAMRVLPVVHQHGRRHRIGDGEVLNAVSHERELLLLVVRLGFVRRKHGGFSGGNHRNHDR